MTMQPASLLAAIVKSSDDAIVAKDLQGRIMAWNAAAERLFGYTPDEAIGRHIHFIIPPERLEEETFVMGRVLEGIGVDHFETVRVRKDGSRVDVSLTVSPVRDGQGRIVGASKIARDITLQKLVAEHLEEERRIIERLDRVGVAVTGTLDRDHIVRVITQSAAELTGARYGAFRYHGTAGTDSGLLFLLPATPRDAFVDLPGGATIDEPFGPRGQMLAVLRIADVITGAAAGQASRAEGERVIRSYLSVPIVSRAGTPFGRVFLGHEDAGVFTERHERLVVGTARWGALALENAQHYLDAQQANRQKDEFLATLSHELRTPLNAIMGWAQILGSAVVDERNRERAIHTIQRNARAQARLIEDLLDVSRIVSGKLDLRKEIVDLRTVIAMAIEDVRPTAAERAIELRAEIEDVDDVVGDPARLQQVVWNLLSNAVKFTPPHGTVTVSLTRTGEVAQMAVTDTGQGIESDLLAHVFDRFRQGDSSATRRHGGLGLGLGIVKHLVEAHGGRVQAFSAGRGHGATFTVTLPIRPAEQDVQTRAKNQPAPAETRASLAGVRVLAVDDEQDAADMLALALRGAGADVITAYGASDALAHASDDGFDVVLADIGMPGMDGCALVRELRGRRNGRPFLGVAVTAYASADDRVRALRAGFDLHLAKPMPPEDVVAAIARALTQQ